MFVRKENEDVFDMENLNNKHGFEPCKVEIVRFGDDIILTSGENSNTNNVSYYEEA